MKAQQNKRSKWAVPGQDKAPGTFGAGRFVPED
jgi:hypothetical protein